jgi:hypothetical protein
MGFMTNIYSGPTTLLHYAANGGFTNNTYAPSAAGFNLADISSADELPLLPSGTKALVYLGMTDGVTTAFKAAVQSFINQPQVFGFYLADEPIPGQVSAANLKAESDYIHSVDPGAKTFIVEYNNTSPQNPSYSFTPANTDIDLFGLDPYPVRPEFTGGVDDSVIAAGVNAAVKAGIPLADIVPVYQAFGATSGDYVSWGIPTVTQEQQLIAAWGAVVPNPAFDYAYSWGTQAGDTALVNDPELQQVFATMFASEQGGGTGDSGGTGGGTGGTTRNVVVTDDTSKRSTTITTAGTTTFGTASITLTSATASATLGSDSFHMRFLGVGSLTLSAGSGNSVISQDSGPGSFTAGSGTLDVTGASDAADAYKFKFSSGKLIIEDFSLAKGDTLTVASGLRRGFTDTSDGHGGTLLTFPRAGAGHTIDLVGVALPKSAVHFN